MSPEDKLYLAQVSENGAQIKHVCLFTCDDQPAENAANAEFIVRACNAHDELLAALEDVNESLASFYEADHKAAGHYFGAALKERIEIAIARANKHEHSA